MQNVVRIFFKGETKSFEKQIEQVETELENMVEEYEAVKKGGSFNDQDLQKFETDIEKTTNKLANLKRKQLEIGQTKVFESMNKGLKQAVRNVLKWGLAFIGLRSAISLVRSSMNTIMGYDKQLVTDMEYIRTAIATALEPVVRRLVDLLKQMLYYVGYIVKIWTGKNIFKDANKNLQKANASAKELAKTTAGFDEMNVLNDNKSSGGVVTPSFDLSVEDQPVPEWVDWISRNGEMLSNVLLGIATSLIAVKLGFSGLEIFGIAMVLSGIVISIKSLLDYIRAFNII